MEGSRFQLHVGYTIDGKHRLYVQGLNVGSVNDAKLETKRRIELMSSSDGRENPINNLEFNELKKRWGFPQSITEIVIFEGNEIVFSERNNS